MSLSNSQMYSADLFSFLSVQSVDKPRHLRNMYCMYKSTFKDLDCRCAKSKERKTFYLVFTSFFLHGRVAWCVSFLQALPEDLTSPSDALSCLLPGNGRQKIDAAVSEGEPEGDERRRKRERRRAGAPGSDGCYFSPFQACAERSTSPPQQWKRWCDVLLSTGW